MNENSNITDNKKDRRIRKTEKQLLNGLTKLMETKSFTNITVRELSELVDINRSTFYLHYQDIYDMVDSIENELIEKFEKTLGEPDSDILKQSILTNSKDSEKILHSTMASIFQLVADNKKICKALLGPNGDIKFVNKVSDIIKDRIGYILDSIAKNKYSSIDIELVNNFFVNGCIGLVQYWLSLNDDDFKKTDPEHVADIFYSLVRESATMIS